MSFDRPGGGDHFPDGPVDEDRPFPGASRDRELVSAETGPTISMEHIRARYAQAGSAAELASMAEADEAALAAGLPLPDFGTTSGEVPAEPSAAGSGDGQDSGAWSGFFSRPGDLQDQSAAEVGEPEVSEPTAPGTDTSQQVERGEDTSGENAVDGQAEQAEDGQQQKPKDLPQTQYPAPDAETDRPAETASEAAPDQQPDDPRMVAMETRIAEFASMFESMQAKLDASERRSNELEARLDASQTRNEELEAKVADLEASSQEDKAKIREWEARIAEAESGREPDGRVEDSEQAESLLNPDVIRPDDDSDDPDVEEADVAAFDHRGGGRDNREADGTLEVSERPGVSADTVQAGQDALSLAGSLGIVNPLVSLAVSADSARRKFQKMAPADQLDVINLTDSATKAFGSMSPGTAVVAVTVGTVAPLMGDKVRNAIHHFRRKDRDE